MEQKRLPRNSHPLSPRPKVPSRPPASSYQLMTPSRSQWFQGGASAIWVKTTSTEKAGKAGAQSVTPPCSPGHPAREEGEVGTRPLWTPTEANLCRSPGPTQRTCPSRGPEASSFPCSRLPRHPSGSRPQAVPHLQALAAGSRELGSTRGCPPAPEAPGHPLGPQRHPAHGLRQTAAIPGSSPRLRATRPQDRVPETGPWWAPANPGRLTSCPLGPVAPGGSWVPELCGCSKPRPAAPDASGFRRLPQHRFSRGSSRELRLSSPGHQRAPAGLGESRGTGRLPSVQALESRWTQARRLKEWWILRREDTGDFPKKSPEASEQLASQRGPDPPPQRGVPAAPVPHCGLQRPGVRHYSPAPDWPLPSQSQGPRPSGPTPEPDFPCEPKLQACTSGP